MLWVYKTAHSKQIERNNVIMFVIYYYDNINDFNSEKILKIVNTEEEAQQFCFNKLFHKGHRLFYKKI